jgi:hypothetical protein
VKIKQRNDLLFFVLLLTIAGMEIGCLAKPAYTQPINFTSLYKSQISDIDRVSFRETMAQFSNNDANDKFKQEQLHDSSSNPNISTQKDVDGWSQPIGWIFGFVFVILGSIVGWSKYNRKR